MKKSLNIKKRRILLSCEHGGNEIPKEWAHLFPKSTSLSSHKGWDIGTLDLAKTLKTSLDSPLFFTTTSRLLVDCNRSLHHPQLFSRYSQSLSFSQKEKILKRYYYPYRNKVETALKKEKGPLLHLSIHSFTPIWKGKERKCDIGILFDPQRVSEKNFAKMLQKDLQKAFPNLHIYLNLPYRGTFDGLVSSFRKQWKEDVYWGIELEINQKLVLEKKKWQKLQKDFAYCLVKALAR